MKIWAHTLVMNEERYIWFAIKSVIDYVDKILVWDTGSEDGTVEIVKILQKEHPKKIEFRQFGEVTPEKYTILRQKMLEKTKSDWLLILDGDEVWWGDSIRKVLRIIESEGENLDTIVNRYYNPVGDIYHYQEEAAGRYEIDGRRGHLTIRAMNRKIPGLYTANPHGRHGYFDKRGTPIQERHKRRRIFADAPFLHFTHMPRSTSKKSDIKVPKRAKKLKKEIGKKFPLDFYYPEVFFMPRLLAVPSPWRNMSLEYKIQSVFVSYLRKLKILIIPPKHGY